MPLPAPTSSARPSVRILAPWVLFVALLGIGLACFYLYADRVPSMLQALSDR